jgi:CheY-like chemotaxis protein
VVARSVAHAKTLRSQGEENDTRLRELCGLACESTVRDVAGADAATGTAGVELLHAPNGRTGLQVFEERRPRLVLLDLHLPAIPGEEVLEGLRAAHARSKPTIIVLSADRSARAS